MTVPKKAEARRITVDRARLFPEFRVRKPRLLLRRIGPVLQGSPLERSTSSEHYCPTAHVHAPQVAEHGLSRERTVT
jgi:hypothetical protein